MLAEGLELSNLFYFWLSGTLDKYLGDSATMEEREIFRENVFGISLSATGLSEVRMVEFHIARGGAFATLVAPDCGKTLAVTPNSQISTENICDPA